MSTLDAISVCKQDILAPPPHLSTDPRHSQVSGRWAGVTKLPGHYSSNQSIAESVITWKAINVITVMLLPCQSQTYIFRVALSRHRCNKAAVPIFEMTGCCCWEDQSLSRAEMAQMADCCTAWAYWLTATDRLWDPS